MNGGDDPRYRLRTAGGFLEEARRDFETRRWRACVADGQMALEHAAKALLATLGPVPRTHEAAQEVARAVAEGRLDLSRAPGGAEALLEDLAAAGSKEHLEAVYGDEALGIPPWDLFDEARARHVLEAAARAVAAVGRVVGRS